MKKNDVLSTLGATAFMLALFGVLWIMGHYPMYLVYGIVAFLIYGAFTSIKSTLKDYLDEQDENRN